GHRRLCERCRRPGAGVLDIDDRHALDPDVAEDALAADLLLPLQQPCERVRRVHRPDVLDTEAGVLEGAHDRDTGEVLERGVGMAPERVHPDPRDRGTHHRATFVRMKSAISGIVVAGWKTALTPTSCSRRTSSSGITPPTITTTSSR